MRFSALFTLGLATVAIATPTKVQRDAAPVESVISAIEDKTDALGSAISSYSGGDTSKVESASTDLISTIKSGVETVNSNGDLTSTDALALTSPVQDLTKKVESVVDSIISKKSDFVAAGAGGTVLESLKAQYAAAQSLSDAISSKVPSELSDLAAQLSAGITKAIQKGIDAYKDAAGSGSSSSSSQGSTATATGGASSTTGGSSATTTAGPSTTSTPVIPTGGSSGSSSAVPSSSAPAGTTSAPLPTFTGAASKAGYSLGGALAAAALVAAF